MATVLLESDNAPEIDDLQQQRTEVEIDFRNASAADKSALLKQHLDLVQRIARNYSHSVKSHYEDLVQVGSIGLLRAIDRFDPNRRTQFRTYAAHLITSEIRHYLRDQVAVVKLPRDLQELLPKVRQVEQSLWSQLDREPEAEEVAEILGISLEKLTEVRQLEFNYAPLSLDQETLGNVPGSHQTVLDQLEDSRRRSFHLAQEDRIIVQDSMRKIKDSSRQIIEFAFYKDLTQTEIAKELGISQMQVSRRLKKALGELWETLNTRVTPW